MGVLKRHLDTVLVVILLAVPFFFLRSTIRRPQERTALDRVLYEITRPVQWASAELARGGSRLVGQYVYLWDVRENNDRLSFENARLRDDVRELASLRMENERLRRLLGLRDSIVDDTVSAAVIAKDASEFFRVWHIVVDAPAAGIAKDMPVVSLDGAVGIVRSVSGDKVEVTTTVDAGFGVDVVVERTQARGFVRGVGDRTKYSVRVQYVSRRDQVEVGDLLVTSGMGCRFPKGIPVARVTAVDPGEHGISQQVEAEPTVDFSRLEEVVVVLRDPAECLSKGERERPVR